MRRSRRVRVLTVGLWLGLLHPAGAQDPGKWELEVHGGGTFSGSVDGTASSLPPAATALSLGSCSFCPTTRLVASWYFGDGTRLLNDTLRDYRLPGQAASLDSVLGTAATAWPNGASVGMRLSRALTRRFSAEFALDYHVESLDFTEEAATALEQSREGFTTAFTSLFTLPPFTNERVSSTLHIASGSARRLDATGVIVVNLRTEGRFIPYVAGGGGISNVIGEEPAATLKGSYQFTFGGLSPFDERDSVTVRTAVDRHTPVGVLGGGIKWNVSPRWGIRADVRGEFSGSRVMTLLDASPASTPSTTISVVTISGFEPSIQFSNVPLVPTSLSGQALIGTPTFESDGVHVETRVTGGVFFRF